MNRTGRIYSNEELTIPPISFNSSISKGPIARALSMCRPEFITTRGNESHNADVPVKLEQWNLCVEHIGDALADRNPQFNRDKWRKDCMK